MELFVAVFVVVLVVFCLLRLLGGRSTLWPDEPWPTHWVPRSQYGRRDR